MIEYQLIKIGNINPSKSRIWKVLETVLSHHIQCIILIALQKAVSSFYTSDAFVLENLTSEQSERCSTWATSILFLNMSRELEEFLKSLNVLGDTNREVSIGL